MLRNYLITALRNLVRNRLYAAINISGLAVGFGAAIFIALFVRDEFSYDRWIPGHDRVFLITETLKIDGRTPVESHLVPLGLAELMKLDFPQIQHVARVVGKNASLRHEGIEANETIYWADPEIFDVLPLITVAGELSAALAKPDGLVLTQRMAEKYFGQANPIGQTMEINRQEPMRVAAVIRDFPSNTHLTAEIIGSGLATFSPLTQGKLNPNPSGAWISAGYTYVRLTTDASAPELEAEMPRFLKRHMEQTVKRFQEVSLWITPLTSVHLKTDNSTTAMKPTSEVKTAYAFSIIGALIVLVASINFVNLMTARAARRGVEVGIRKVTGATRGNLVAQFIGESLLFALLGSAVAIIGVQIFMPAFNAFLGRDIAFDVLGDYALFAIVTGMTIVTGVLAGFYPAAILSKFRPAATLKAYVKRSASSRVRRALIILQFSILIALIVSVAAIYRQSSFAVNEGLRVDKDQVVLVATNCQTAFADRVKTLSGVSAASCSVRSPLTLGSGNSRFKRAGGPLLSLAMYGVDFGYLELYGMKPLAGRFLSRDHAKDATPFALRSPTGPSVVINETAAHRLEFSSPEAALGQTISIALPDDATGAEMEIVGVTPDFSFDSVRSLISPSIYLIGPPYQWLSIKLAGRNLPETLASIDSLWREVGEPRPMTRLFLDQEMGKLYIDLKRQSQLLGAFSVIAIFISGLGLFGLCAFTAEQRTKEIGVRKAMGARTRDILGLLLWQFTKPVLWANVIAWPVGYFVMRRWLDGFAYHIELSPWMFLGASVLALVIAIATVAGHAILVARAQPVTALRYE